MEFERGSEWRKWDLHIHTKDTNKNDQFRSPTFNDFCKTMFTKALEKDIHAIGITDYFSIDNYLRVIKYLDDKISSDFETQKIEKIKEILLLPNVELRMLPVTDSNNLINIHCVFNPDSNFLNSLENDFFGTLECSRQKMNRAGFIQLGKNSSQTNEQEAYKKGINSFVLEPSNLKELFERKPELKQNTIVVVSNSNKDGASGLQNHYKYFENEDGNLDEIRKNIYQLSDAVFSSNPEDRKFFLGKKGSNSVSDVTRKCGSLKPCIHGSDAHKEEDLFNPHQNRFCWIKSDLTFEGFKQIIQEPEDRVKIQEGKPEEKSEYFIIDNIEIKHDSVNQIIPLNQNLNSIIGGRSTGKSNLIQIIAGSIDENILKDKFTENANTEFITKIIEKSRVNWKDGNEVDSREIEYFAQNRMLEIASEKMQEEKQSERNEIIKKIIKDFDESNLIETYEENCKQIASDLQNKVDYLFSLHDKITNDSNLLKQLGNESGLIKQIDSLKQEIGLKNRNKFKKNELEIFNQLITKKEEIEQKKLIVERDTETIEKLKKVNFFDDTFEHLLNDISPEQQKILSDSWGEIKKDATEKWQKILDTELLGLNNKRGNLIKKFIEIEEKNLYKKGEENLKNNKLLNNLNNRLNEEQSKLQKYKNTKTSVIQSQKQFDNLLQNIVNKHSEFQKEINSVVNKLSIELNDIVIKAEKLHKTEKCKSTLEDFINLQGSNRRDYVDNWADNYQSNIQNHLKDFVNNLLNNRIELKAYKEPKELIKAIIKNNWFSFNYELNYENDSFEQMSDGKKAFVILRLLLDFSKKECPILIDQPEDSLDNRTIYNDLVKYIKEKKKQRQIILVTHNANVVVNADAEEVIVANQHGINSQNKNDVKFQYISGSLENTMPKNNQINSVLESQGIKEHVCEILEGGQEAFQKREKKYEYSLKNL